MKRSIYRINALVLSVGLLLSPCLVSNASAKPLDNSSKNVIAQNQDQVFLSSDVEQRLRAEFLEDGVDSKTVDTLIEKKKKGQELDCEKESELKKVPNNFYSFNLNEYNTKKIYRFADGSYLKVSIQGAKPEKVRVKNNDTKNNGGISVYSIEKSHYATIYKDEWIQATYGENRMGFYASFTMTTGEAHIQNAYDANGWGIGDWSTSNGPTIVHADTYYDSEAALAVAGFKQVSTNWIGMSKTNGYTCSLKVYPTRFNVSITKH